MKIILPDHLKGFSGKVGDIIIYNRFGNTYARKAPGSYNKIPTAKQAAARERFIAAHEFAKSIIANPVLKSLYALDLGTHTTVYSKAVSDYLSGKAG